MEIIIFDRLMISDELRGEIPYAIEYEMALSMMTKNVSFELSSEIPFIKFSL